MIHSFAAYIALAVAPRMASLCLRDCRWASAQVGQRVWPSIAEFVQLLQSPNSLAFRRCSWAIRRARSPRSGVRFLWRSYSARSCRLASTSAGVGSGQCFGCRAFGAASLAGLLEVVFRVGFPTRFFRLAGRPPALAGSGSEKVNSKVWPTAHSWGASIPRMPCRPEGAVDPRISGACLGSESFSLCWALF